jgi:hypothetical protein
MLDLNSTEGHVSNSAVGLSDLLHPRMFVAPVETLTVVDMWQVKWLSELVTEARGRKMLIRHHGSRGWAVLNR